MPRKAKTVLCIDDNQVAVSGWSLYLQQQGYSVLSSCNAEEGLQIFATQPVDAVILDYAMPELNGSAASALMKHMKPDVPIILFTGMAEIPTSIATTIDAFMVKGRPPAELLKKLDELLNISQHAESA